MKKLSFVLAFAALIFAQETDVFVPDEIPFSENEIQAEILLSVNDLLKTIICDFSKNDEEKVVKIVCISGNPILEISVDSSQKTLDIPTKNLNKGIYIIRILSKETQKSILSKAIIVG